ncbi:MAG: fibronectin type III domain-containing protein, partial [Bacteroidales bacterium]|nr:fibronectin type III domain-containing protein [Bacteroidales bacterium]
MLKFLSRLLLIAALCVPWVTQAQCTGTSCTITINATDDYGDGWNGASIGVYQGTTLRGTFTFTDGSSTTSTIVVCSDDSVRFVWTTGSYDDECNFTIYNGDGTTIISNAWGDDYSNGQTIATAEVICPTCPAPSNLTAALTDDGIEISWVANGDETSWLVYVNGEYETTVYTEDYTITSPVEGTLYSITVAAFCGVGDTSIFIGPAVVTVPGAAISVFPYSTGFEVGDDSGWDFANDATNKWCIGTATASTGTTSLYISNNNGAANAYTNSATQFSYAYRAFTVDDGVDMAISFDWKAYGESSYDYLRAWIAPVTFQFSAGHSPDGGTSAYNYTNTTPAGWIDLGGKMNLQSNWQTQVSTFHVNAGTYYLVFMWANDASGGSTPPAAVDNIILTELSCSQPQNLTVDALQTSADLMWTAGGEETDWELQFEGNSYFLTDTFYTAQNLTANTPYTFSVRAICGAGDTSFWSTYSFRTPCNFIDTLPYTNDFESVSTGSYTSFDFSDPCWVLNTDATMYPYVYVSSSSSYNHTPGGSKGIYWYNTTSTGTYGTYQCLVLPGVDIDELPLNTLQMYFWAKASDGSYMPDFEVGVMTDPTNINTFTLVNTINVRGTNWAKYETFFSAYEGTGRYIAIRANLPTSYWYAYVDDVTIDLMPSCPHVISVSVDSASTDYLGISWVPAGEESEWVIYLNDSVIGIANDTVYDIENLDLNTQYSISVAALCDNTDTSEVVTTYGRTLAGEPISDFPYVCGFETTDDANQAADWVLENGTQTNYWMVGTATQNGGSRSLYITNDGSTNSYSNSSISYTYAYVTFQFNAGEYAYSYDWKCMGESHYYDFTRVFITPATESFTAGSVLGGSTNSFSTASVPAGWIDITQSGATPNTLSQSSSWQTATGTFPITTQGLYKLVFVWANDGSGGSNPPTAIDNVMLAQNTCPSPANLTSLYSSQDSVILTWQPLGTETQWVVSYGGNSTVVTDTVFVADNLSSNTEYTFAVRAICGEGDTSMPVTHSVRTDCGNITILPFIEGFEGLPAGNSSTLDPEVPCWACLDNASSYHFGYPSNTSSWSDGPHSGSSFLYYYMPNTTGTYADWIITILPPIDVTTYPISTLQLSFWVKMYSSTTSGDIQVGVISNVTDESTFIPLDTVHVAGDVYDLKTAYLSGFADYADTVNATHIALKYLRNPSTTTYYFVDDITIEPIPACPPVTNITLVSVDTGSLSVTWTENGEAASWTIEYGVTGFTPGAGTTATVTSLPYTINGLNAGITYDVYVTPECTTGVAATRMESFTTLASLPATVPYSCDFEATGVNGWDLIQAGQANYWVVSTATSNGGSQSMYVTDNGTANSYSGNASYSFAVRTFNLQAGNYICSYDWKCNGESSYDFIRAALVPAGTNIEAGVYCGFDNASAMPAGGIALDGGYRQNLSTNWQNQVTEFTLTDAGTYKMVFLWRNDGSVYNQPPAAIDNVQLMLNTCPMPTNITLSNLAQTGTDVSWEEVGTATAWEYQLGNNTPVIVTDTFCTLTGLTANTPYAFRVRSICGVGDTGMWATYNFRTPCGYVNLPYIEDFENENTSNSNTGSAFVNCWNRLNNGTSYGGYPYVSSSSTYNHTVGGTKGLYWYNTTTTGTYGDYQCVVLPPVDPSVGVDSLQVSFWAKASSSSYTPVFKIGVMTDPNNIATFVGIDTVTINTTNWTLVEVPLTTYTGTGHYVAVKADRPTSSWYAYVDDFVLEYVPTCLMPQNVHSTAASTTSITVDWTDFGTPMSWEVRYSTSDNNTTTVTTTSHPFIVTGLDAMTAYTFEVRAICTVGDTSRWSEMTTLSTDMCDNAINAYNYDPTAPSTTSSYSPIGYATYNYSYVQTIIDSACMAGMEGA